MSRAAARGITLWLGVGMGNYYNDKTPWAEWFDDAAWTNTVLPNARDLAGGARLLGFAGLAFDEELYPGKTGIAGDWDWNYPGNTHSEPEVRAQVRARGAQLMQAIASGFPNSEIVVIGWRLPEGWEELAQQVINGIPNANAARVDIDFWDGMTSVPGYGPIRFMDHSFEKFWHMPRSNWDIALTYNANRLFAMFSRRLSNWSYASSRIQVSPFAWIAAGPKTGFQDARPPDFAATQLAAFRRWGTGGAFANYASSGLYGFDYTPYVAALQAAATPGVVDTQAPVLTVQATGRVAETAPRFGHCHRQHGDPRRSLEHRLGPLRCRADDVDGHWWQLRGPGLPVAHGLALERCGGPRRAHHHHHRGCQGSGDEHQRRGALGVFDDQVLDSRLIGLHGCDPCVCSCDERLRCDASSASAG